MFQETPVLGAGLVESGDCLNTLGQIQGGRGFLSTQQVTTTGLGQLPYRGILVLFRQPE
jgi:hypothetical protein